MNLLHSCIKLYQKLHNGRISNLQFVCLLVCGMHLRNCWMYLAEILHRDNGLSRTLVLTFWWLLPWGSRRCSWKHTMGETEVLCQWYIDETVDGCDCRASAMPRLRYRQRKTKGKQVDGWNYSYKLVNEIAHFIIRSVTNSLCGLFCCSEYIVLPCSVRIIIYLEHNTFNMVLSSTLYLFYAC